ncbi:unnamed protein product [Oikopleura dioica]|uniref:EF-hand domain-containing protein n=1 Tax=Oikopleura dioica TaxID=34765 RepID=E4XMZ0_OIKDI|nr:unnamed protein product [Oikopleura dioica]
MNMDDFLELMQHQIRANTSDRNADSLPAATVAFFADAFRLFDKDQDGYLNMDELKNALSLVGQDGSAENLMAASDANKDNKLDFDEFVEMMKDIDV